MSSIPAKNHKGYFVLGKIIRTHGYKGGLKAFFDVDRPQEYRQLDMLFIEIKDQLIPWMIESVHLENNKANLILADLKDIDSAEKLVGHYIYLPEELLPKLTGNKFYFHEVNGFKVKDETHGDIGVIDRVIDLPNNPLFSVLFKNSELLIPISDAIIKKVDRKNKTIHIRAPEGLIEIYL